MDRARIAEFADYFHWLRVSLGEQEGHLAEMEAAHRVLAEAPAEVDAIAHWAAALPELITILKNGEDAYASMRRAMEDAQRRIAAEVRRAAGGAR